MSKNGFGRTIKREVMRAMLERTQSMDTGKMMAAFGSSAPVVYDDIEETLNVAYVNREEFALAMDIFKPKDSGRQELPVIVIVHGGGLFMGQRDLERPYCRLLAHKGYLVFSLEYRLAPKATIMQQFDDVCAGMDRVGEMLVDYEVDFSRMFLMADSAGAYLTAYVAAMHDSEKLQNAIGHKPSRMVFAAVGFICGMFYTNKMLEEQVFGDRRDDKDFLQYMNIENPEIVNNLPPAFLLTSCGDTFNNFSIKFHKALKKAGRVSKLLYLGDEELMHIFPITNPEHPRSLEATDRMLAWFEEQADIRRAARRKDPAVTRRRARLQKRIEDGSVNSQKAWANIKERLAVDPALLKRVAVIDCTREYSYEQMFAEWERYARVFSGLEIGSMSHSRVALCGAVTAEPLFALYALNMTGAEVSLFSYPDFLPNGMWKEMIEKEKITDLIVADIMVTPEIWEELGEVREACGLRHVLLLHSLMGGPTVGPAELVYNEYNYHTLKRKPGAVVLNDLFTVYQDTDLSLDKSRGERLAFIAHTSGTTHGTRKMLPLTDKIINETVNAVPGGFRSFLQERYDGKPLRIAEIFDFSSIMALSGLVHGQLARGETLVMTFFGFMHPKFIRAIGYYNINVLTLTGFMVDKWLERGDLDGVDFSSLKVVGLSGGYTSPEKLEKYREFFKAHGYQYDITVGYGMSEAGGELLFAPREEAGRDVLGSYDDPEKVRIKDENDGGFYRPTDGPRTGVLYLYSQTRPGNELDGQVLYEYTRIDEKEFLCTNDLVRVNADGSLSFAGRADQYFVNNEGRRFDAGVVEQNMAACSAVMQCAVAPVLDKRIHDTVPVLYVVPAVKGPGAAESIRKAFVEVFVRDKKLTADDLPTQFMLVDAIPLNPNGKPDVFRITRSRLDGEAYNLVPVTEAGALTDIRAEHVEKLNSVTGGTLPAGMENHSAYSVFDLFNTPPQRKAFGRRSGAKGEKKEKPVKLPEIPEDVMKFFMKHGNRLAGLSNGRRWIDVDFED